MNEIKRWGSVGVFHLFHGSVGKAVGNIHHGRVLDILLLVHVSTRSLLGSLGGDVHRGDGLVGDVNGEHSVGSCCDQLMNMTGQETRLTCTSVDQLGLLGTDLKHLSNDMTSSTINVNSELG